ncbi:uncharacterized protein JCM15063_006193 [Sporobolomyces koalae]|uniref:uncharacterized protein n=1 Tax=Sporobolomyces koalae TaxID=500713 RepID=UPI003172B9B2
MALVSSLAPSTPSLYSAPVPSLHTRLPSDSPRPLVSSLSAASAPPGQPRSMNSSPSLATVHTGYGPGAVAGSQHAGKAYPRGGGGGAVQAGLTNYAASSARHGSSSVAQAYGLSAESNATAYGTKGSSPSSTYARLPSPVPPPSRSASTPPSATSSPARPTATPLPSDNASGSFYRHQHSSSSSSIPRISPAQYSGHQQGQQQYMPHATQHVHPSFVGQAYSPFAPPHAFAHPAFPFVPSPHPSQNSTANNYVNYTPNGQVTPGGSAEQQKRLQSFQQAQWAQAAGQMEMLRTHQAMADWQQNEQARKRTHSGPAASPTYHTSPLPYSPSPSPSLQTQSPAQYSFASGNSSSSSLPAGAMLPHFSATHGYPTPPGSVEGVVRGGESGGSSSGGSREGGYHPYRRDHQHHQATKSSSSDSGTRSTSTTPRSHSTTPSTSSASSRVAVPKLNLNTASPSTQGGSRGHASSPSVTSIRSATLPSSFSQSSLQAHQQQYAARPRTQSAQSSASPSIHRSYPDSQSNANVPSTSSLSARPRTTSFESTRSNTPQQGGQQNRPRPSPLGGVHQRLPVDSDDESDEEGIESDHTAETNARVNPTVTKSPTMTSMATIRADSTATAGMGAKVKDKEKKGMASRFKKAFGGGSSSSNPPTLTSAEVDGKGAKDAGQFARVRRDSVSSSETSTNPRTPPAHHASHPSFGSITSSASTTTRTLNGDADSTRKAPSTSRFRLLNSKLNSSTDNISISSTVSSASVMIRRLGQMGKLARRNSLMGLTKAFKKDKSKDAAADEDDSPVAAGKKDKKSKAGVSVASVSHATAEVEASPRSTGMSPAAALAKRQQMHYAEQEAEEARARAAAAAEAAKLGPPAARGLHGRTDSDSASIKSGKSGRWGIGRSKTTDDALESRTKALEKEKDKLKSRGGGSKFGRLGFGGSKTDLRSDAASNYRDDASSIAGTERGGSALGLYHDADTTPRQSLEILAPPQAYGEALRRAPSSDYEPSLYRNGATPVTQPRAVKGILKGAGTYSQEHYARPKPGFIRNRASSFDAPQQHGRPSSSGSAALVNVIPSQAQVDGVVSSSTSTRFDSQPPAMLGQGHDTVSNGGGTMYGNPSMNSSAPVLTQFAAQNTVRSNSTPGATGRRIAFAANLSVHTTWPAAIYDRRAEPATCNRLTPTLAQQIKEELNSFKMEEMDVHPDSRKLTHFFV